MLYYHLCAFVICAVKKKNKRTDERKKLDTTCVWRIKYILCVYAHQSTSNDDKIIRRILFIQIHVVITQDVPTKRARQIVVIYPVNRVKSNSTVYFWYNWTSVFIVRPIHKYHKWMVNWKNKLKKIASSLKTNDTKYVEKKLQCLHQDFYNTIPIL